MGGDSTAGETKDTNGGSKTALTVDTGASNSRANPRQSPMNSTTRSTSINSHIEEKIGCCLEEFRCQHNNFTGILYVGPLGIVFLGRFLLFEWTVVINWEDVKKVRRKASTPTAFDNTNTNVAIRIETSTPAPGGDLSREGVYDFEGFFDSEKALEALIGLHNDSLLDNTDENKVIISKRGSVIPLRRSTSDPAKQISNIFSFDDETPVLQASPNHEDPDHTTILDLRNQYSAKNKEAMQKIAAASTGSPSRVNVPKAKVLTGKEASQEELEAEWETICSKLETYPAAPVRDRELILEKDLDLFVDRFIGDDAPYSWCRFMTEVIGDSEVNANDWTQVNANDSVAKTLTRAIEYTHPVNAPMAPPTARACKEQTLKQYDGFGLVIETKTVVSDVPMTDCFYVRDILQIKRSHNKWLLNIRFEVVFVKSTMFRGLINKTTTSEFEKFMNHLAGWLSDHSGKHVLTDSLERANRDASENAEAVKEVPKVHPQAESGIWRIFIAIVCILWMAQFHHQLYTNTVWLKEDLRELKSIIVGMETQRLEEERLLRLEWNEWKSTILDLEQTRIAEAQALKSNLNELKSSFGEHETFISDKTQLFREELIEWKSELLESQREVECSQSSSPESIQSTAHISRAGGISGPLKMERKDEHGQEHGLYPNSGQKMVNIDDMNDGEKLEQ